MPEEKEEETPEKGVRRIDMRALERGVRKALEIKPTASLSEGIWASFTFCGVMCYVRVRVSAWGGRQDSNLHLLTLTPVALH